jgi:hypothetical protein
LDPSWPIIGWELLEANPLTVGDTHAPPDRADPTNGLLPDLGTAQALRTTSLGKNSAARGLSLIPIAIARV